MHIEITFKVVWIGKLFVGLAEFCSVESLSVDSEQTLSYREIGTGLDEFAII